MLIARDMSDEDDPRLRLGRKRILEARKLRHQAAAPSQSTSVPTPATSTPCPDPRLRRLGVDQAALQRFTVKRKRSPEEIEARDQELLNRKFGCETMRSIDAPALEQEMEIALMEFEEPEP